MEVVNNKILSDIFIEEDTYTTLNKDSIQKEISKLKKFISDIAPTCKDKTSKKYFCNKIISRLEEFLIVNNPTVRGMDSKDKVFYEEDTSSGLKMYRAYVKLDNSHSLFKVSYKLNGESFLEENLKSKVEAQKFIKSLKVQDTKLTFNPCIIYGYSIIKKEYHKYDEKELLKLKKVYELKVEELRERYVTPIESLKEKNKLKTFFKKDDYYFDKQICDAERNFERETAIIFHADLNLKNNKPFLYSSDKCGLTGVFRTYLSSIQVKMVKVKTLYDVTFNIKGNRLEKNGFTSKRKAQEFIKNLKKGEIK